MNISFDVAPLQYDEKLRRISVRGSLSVHSIQNSSGAWRHISEYLDRFYRTREQYKRWSVRTTAVPFEHISLITSRDTNHLRQQALEQLMQLDYGDYVNDPRIDVRNSEHPGRNDSAYYFGYGVFNPGKDEQQIGTLEVGETEENGQPVQLAASHGKPAAFYDSQEGIAFAVNERLAPAIAPNLVGVRGLEAEGCIFYLGRNVSNVGPSDALEFLSVRANDGRRGPFEADPLVEGRWTRVRRAIGGCDFWLRFESQTNVGRFRREPPPSDEPAPVDLARESRGRSRDLRAETGFAPSVRRYFEIADLKLPRPSAWGDVRRIWINFTADGWLAHSTLFAASRALVVSHTLDVRRRWRADVFDYRKGRFLKPRVMPEGGGFEIVPGKRGISLREDGDGLLMTVSYPLPDVSRADAGHGGARAEPLGYLGWPFGPMRSKRVQLVQLPDPESTSYSMFWLNQAVRVSSRNLGDDTGLAEWWLSERVGGRPITLTWNDEREELVVEEGDTQLVPEDPVHYDLGPMRVALREADRRSA